MGKTFLIGICGPSTSGKSTLAKSLGKEFNAVVIEADNFLKSKPKRKVSGYTSWEHPNNMWMKDFKKSIYNLKKQKETIIPSKKLTDVFDKKINPAKIIIVEGFLLFYKKSFSKMFDIKIFIDIPFEKIVKRRVDYCGEKERDYSEKVVIPEHLKFRKNMINNSDFVLNGNKTKLQLKKEVIKIIKNKLKWT